MQKPKTEVSEKENKTGGSFKKRHLRRIFEFLCRTIVPLIGSPAIP